MCIKLDQCSLNNVMKVFFFFFKEKSQRDEATNANSQSWEGATARELAKYQATR